MNTAAALHSGSATDQGLQRTRNEDRIWADDVNGIYAVLDGLGGHAGGELAAQTALDVIVRELTEFSESAVRNAITAANNAIYSLAQASPENSGMACVLTLAVVRGETVIVGHVGDSRLYLIWNGTIRKLTSDHSPVGEQEDQGELTEAEAMEHPRRNEVFRDVGSRERTADDDDFIDVRSFPFHSSAALLLCTDGLSDQLASTDMAAIIETYSGDAEAIANSLVEAANERGGADNISVVFVPGPEFLGMQSAAMSDARARHAITRIRPARARWKRRLLRAAWLFMGILLGMALLAAFQRIWNAGGLLR